VERRKSRLARIARGGQTSGVNDPGYKAAAPFVASLSEAGPLLWLASVRPAGRAVSLASLATTQVDERLLSAKVERNLSSPAMPTPAATYLDHASAALDRVREQLPAIASAADWCAGTILAGRMVHLFGSGHSRIMVEEMWPRYGSFPGFNPIVELSLSFHNLVVGANGQRQAMFLENVPGLAARILRNFDLSKDDTALVISSSGANIVPVEMAEEFQAAGVRVIGLVSRDHADASDSKRADGKKLTDFSDLVLDTGAPAGDACVAIPGVAGKVAPLSTVGGCAVINALKAEIAQRLSAAGRPPLALAAANQVGAEKAAEIFEAAYDEHARRLAELYRHLGESPSPSQNP